MTKAEKDIINFVLNIPVENWDDFKTIVNGIGIKIFGGECGYNPRIIIDGTTIYSKRLFEYYDMIYDRYVLVQQGKEKDHLRFIYNKLTCKE